MLYTDSNIIIDFISILIGVLYIFYKMTKAGNGETLEEKTARDKTVGVLDKEIGHLNDFIQNTEKEWAQMVIKLKRERLVALAALSRSKKMLAEMEIFIAESELKNFCDITPPNEDRDKAPTRRQPRQPVSSRRRPSFNSRRNSVEYSYHNNNSNNHNIGQNRSQSPIVPVSCNSSTRDSGTGSNSSTSSSDSNRHLTDSIIAEFEKPYLSNRAAKPNNHDGYSNIHKWSMSAPNLSQKQPRVEIKPVSNIEAYKKSYTHYSLSYKSHILYSPPSGNIKPSLHPKDPRNNSKILSESVSQPMTLAVPQLLQNIPQTPQTQPDKRHTINSYKSVSTQAFQDTLKQDQEYKPSATPKTNMQTIPFHSTPNKRTQNRSAVPQILVTTPNIPSSTPQKQETKHICVPTPPLYNNSPSTYIFGHNSKTEVNFHKFTPTKWQNKENVENKEGCTPV